MPSEPVPSGQQPSTGPLLVRTRDELAQALADRPGPRAVVMTMGALHQGHLDLVRQAVQRVGTHGTVVVTIFVNPLQFAAGEDLETYPRDLGGDLARLEEALGGTGGSEAAVSEAGGRSSTGADRLVVFAPTQQEVYPGGQPQVRIDPGPVGRVLEGRTRPTHFAGVCQVVLTLLHLTAPRWALFGRKDAQQLAVVRAMVRDLAVPVEVVAVDTRREADGLAMSSRNAYLSPEERRQALALSQALTAGREAAAAGARPQEVREAALRVLERAPGARVDYVALVEPDTFVDLAGVGLGLVPRAPGGRLGQVNEVSRRQGLLAVAAWVGATRLIDNTILELAARD
ncbi:4-phosphopantoate--beta-alanine ligase [Actinomyces lilanjuaniae]|uniref:4-phosphopantoate--beta-alanine ligase n=1 Tax=Actinomyces lilanjuaniae TaxID=2321394 RepID=UPI001FAA353E|nr:pantoate--beta-alanine ligase [Actinomyces lilanjuaniae]